MLLIDINQSTRNQMLATKEYFFSRRHYIEVTLSDVEKMAEFFGRKLTDKANPDKP